MPTISPRRTLIDTPSTDLALLVDRVVARSSRRSRRATSPTRAGCAAGSGGPGRGRPCRVMMPVLGDVAGLARRASRWSARRAGSVTESATGRISFSLCEMMMRGDALASQARRMRSRRLPLSSSLSAAVGSSRMSSFTFFDSALAISTSCCLPTPMSATRVCRVARAAPPAAAARAACGGGLVPADDAAAWRARCRGRCSRRWTATATSASSWWMITMPAASLARMSLNWRGSPSKTISPS